MMNKALSILIVLAFLTAPLTTVVGTVGVPHSVTSKDLQIASAVSRGQVAPTGFVDVTVENTLSIPRPKEVVRLSVPFGLDELRDLNMIKVVNNQTQTEVLSGALPSTVELYPNGSIKRMDIAFQDDFAGGIIKHYKIIIGQASAMTGNNMTTTSGGSSASVKDGFKSYSIGGSQTGTNGAYVKCSNATGDAFAYFLSRMSGNQFTPDQVQFSIFWGNPTLIETDSNRVMATVHLVYTKPTIALWGGPTKSDFPVASADIVLNFYHGRDMVEILATKTVNEQVYNHNGYVQEFTSLDAGEDTYEVMFGNSHHTVMTAETKSFTTVANTTAFKNVTSSWRAAPAFADWDGDGDLDLVLGDENGTLTAYKNIGNKTVPNWTKDLVMFNGIDVGNYSVPEFVDIDGNGVVDLIVGTGAGTASGDLMAYRNTGTASVPVWTLDNTLVPTIAAGNFGATPSLADLNGDGTLDLVIGDPSGGLTYYKNTGTKTVPAWTVDTATFLNLNTGATRKPGTYSSPDFYDVNGDGVLDFISGVETGQFGATEFYYNTGTKTAPKFDFLFPGAVNNVRGGDHTHPQWADINGDGKSDLVLGRSDGKVDYYINMGNSTAQRAGANMQPLANGSYRFWYDQDRNDGPYMTVDTVPDFKDYYVLSSPKTYRAVMRYIQDFDDIVYKDQYYGNAYPSAGGNVSYYPYLPNEDGYITRGGITFGAYAGGSNAGTFISQTGTAAGFIQMPVASKDLTTREVVLDRLLVQQPSSYYDDLATILKTPLVVTSLVDLATLEPRQKPSSNPVSLQPSSGQLQMVQPVYNLGGTPATNVKFEFHSNVALNVSDLMCTGTIANLPGFSSADASCQWDPKGVAGVMKVFLVLDPLNTTKELDEFNNIMNITVVVPLTSWTLSPTFQVTNDAVNKTGLSPDIVIDSTGKPWITWSAYRGKENFDIGVSSFDGTAWSKATWVSNGKHWAVDPALSADANGKVWLTYSDNNREYQEYLANWSARNYWNSKFDVYLAQYDGTSWAPSARVTNAFAYNDTDQAPDVTMLSNGSALLTYRNTHFDLYQGGNQINNAPYSDLDILARSYNSVSKTWGANISIDTSSGSQGWWRGPQVSSSNGQTWFVWDSESFGWGIKAMKYNASGFGSVMTLPVPKDFDGKRPAVAALPDGTAWVVFESKLANTTAVFATHYDGSAWSTPAQLTFSERPDMKAVIAVDSLGNPWVAYESLRDGNKEIYLRHFNGLFWSAELRITKDPASDQEPAIAVGPTGSVWVTWQSDRNGLGRSAIFARKVTGGGTPPTITGVTASPQPVYEDQVLTFTSSVTDDKTPIMKGWDLDGKGSDSGYCLDQMDLIWTTKDTIDHTYPQAGTYKVRFTAVDTNDLAVQSNWLTVKVINKAPVAVAGKDRFVAEDTVVTFNGSGSYDTPADMALGLEYKWNFGDKSVNNVTQWSHNASARHTYTAYGFYNVTLSVRDDDLDLDNASINVTVYNLKPIVNMTMGNFTAIEDEVLTFKGFANDTLSDQATVQWRWVFGDGTFSDWSRDTSVTHTYTERGIYKAMFIAQDKDNMTDNASVTINVTNVAPTIFEVTGPTGDVLEDTAAVFTGTGADTPTDQITLKYFWDFGDGTNSGWTNATEASHNYTTMGKHNVTFTVKDNDGATATTKMIINVDDPDPEAEIDASVPTKTDEDKSMTFKGTGTDTVSDQANLNYTWDLGDGTIAYGTSVNHTYTQAKVYTVTFSVMDNEGMVGTAQMTVTVTNLKPIAKAAADKSTVKIDELVTFSSAGSTDTLSDVATLKYLWTFGDGTSSTDKNPTHAYTSSGVKTVKLTVTDNDLELASMTLSITVKAKPTTGGGGVNMMLVAAVIIIVIVAVILIVLAIMMMKKGSKPKPKSKVKKAAEDDEEEVEEAEEEAEIPKEKAPKKVVKGAAVAAATTKDEEE
jgi:PKD repeat protein